MSAVPQEQGPSSATSLGNGTVSSPPEVNAGKSQSTSGLGEKAVPPSVGSPGRQGEIAYLFHLEHGSGMTGYVGKMSEVSWLQRVREYFVGQPQVAGSDTTPAALDLHSAQAHDLTYFMDNEDLLSVDEEDVDAYRMPPPATALLLCEAYFHALQGAFQFVKRDAFLRILDQLCAEPKHTTWAERRTLGLANIIFALGAKWLDDTNLDQNGITESHTTYYARARSLGLDHRILFDHPDVQMVQAIGILAFYLMTNGSIQRYAPRAVIPFHPVPNHVRLLLLAASSAP